MITIVLLTGKRLTFTSVRWIYNDPCFEYVEIVSFPCGKQTIDRVLKSEIKEFQLINSLAKVFQYDFQNGKNIKFKKNW